MLGVWVKDRGRPAKGVRPGGRRAMVLQRQRGEKWEDSAAAGEKNGRRAAWVQMETIAILRRAIAALAYFCASLLCDAEPLPQSQRAAVNCPAQVGRLLYLQRLPDAFPLAAPAPPTLRKSIEHANQIGEGRLLVARIALLSNAVQSHVMFRLKRAGAGARRHGWLLIGSVNLTPSLKPILCPRAASRNERFRGYGMDGHGLDSHRIVLGVHSSFTQLAEFMAGAYPRSWKVEPKMRSSSIAGVAAHTSRGFVQTARSA
ncbi:hypothetical protein SNOG_05016 [Parastagonospora nodorum SN15]|uniref:Uncharacterized protein n=1 Tax=Phaeosphaeria nodorum (strain SN15 / ATCC MYA-4574 / FGSC 10173) TaxID=321614 RepID=Q0UT98_PHANO|nr:hypothetical protein SNOG_05016 [Parastagonospora nodorum SN15]EAT87407.1 hypothetical protein SNOG_05016 [Parastagonospora nodorum SN15]